MYGSFTLRLISPQVLLTGWFATKIFHPNVSSTGEICVNTLKKDWKPSYGVGHILVTVKCLLIYPNPDSALDEEAGKLLQENYESYCERAKLITSVHATPKVRPVILTKFYPVDESYIPRLHHPSLTHNLHPPTRRMRLHLLLPLFLPHHPYHHYCHHRRKAPRQQRPRRFHYNSPHRIRSRFRLHSHHSQTQRGKGRRNVTYHPHRWERRTRMSHRHSIRVLN
jgi:hypothetical protein